MGVGSWLLGVFLIASCARARITLPARQERRQHDRRAVILTSSWPRLSRSAYEQVFRKLSSGKRLAIGGEMLTPVGVKGWYHAVFRNGSNQERLLSIDDVLRHMDAWRL